MQAYFSVLYLFIGSCRAADDPRSSRTRLLKPMPSRSAAGFFSGHWHFRPATSRRWQAGDSLHLLLEIWALREDPASVLEACNSLADYSRDEQAVDEVGATS